MAARKNAKTSKTPKTTKLAPDLGRPPKITKAWADRKAETLAQMYANGESLAEVCAELDICKESYYKACEISPAFSDSDKKGKMLSEAWWTKLGRAGSAGKVNIQPATWCFNMKNRFGWRDRQEITHESESLVDALKDLADQLPG